MLKKFALPLLLLVCQSPAFSATAIFAGGCFWCVESDFDKVPGVTQTISGYDGGTIKNPTYPLVSSGRTNYAEVVKVVYDEKKVNYKTLVNYFFTHIDPLVKDKQFCDTGHQYRSAIFYLNDKQKKIAEEVKSSLSKIFKGKTIYTEISPSTTFYPAEGYHQNYYKKNPYRYQYYRYRCGRDKRVKEVWRHV